MVAYILAVNPQILGVTGGNCDPQELCTPEGYRIRGKDCLFDSYNTAATECLTNLRLGLTTATAASSLIACFIMGFFANLPLALAPGMGINIYVAYQIVAQGLLTYQEAMVAIFLEGWIFIILSMTGIRGGIIRLMPKNIAFASSVGIGLLLAFSGLRNLGVIVFDSNTLVTLGGCPTENHQYTLTTSYPLDITSLNTTLNSTQDIIHESNAAVYSCGGGEMRSATMWLGIAGGFLMAGLTAGHVRGSLFLGIAFITIISWIPGSPVSYLGAGSDIPGGEARLNTFKKVVAAPSLEGIGLDWDWGGVNDGHFWVALFTFLYIDLLDCTGTLLSMATLLDDCMIHDAEEDGKLEIYEPFLKENREFEGQQWAFLSDGIGIVVGSMMGITPVTVYIESAAGIEDGGRTGVTAIAVAFFFFIALFFSPILASIPPYATGPALILVGVMLIAHVDRIVWDDTLESIPAFLTVIVMPFTLSVAYGVIAGIVSYLGLHIPVWAWQWMKVKMAELKKRRRRRKRRNARARAEAAAAAGGGDGGGAGGGGTGGFDPTGRNTSGGDLNDGDNDDSEEDETMNGAASASSGKSRRRVHRKVFGLDDSSRHNFSTHGSEGGGVGLGGLGSGGSMYGDLASLEVIDPGMWGGTGGGGTSVRHGGGLRRSTSHGNFHPGLVGSAGGGGAGGGGGGSVYGGSVHGNTSGMAIGRSGPRGMPRSMSHAGGGGSGYSSRNGSFGQETGILAGSLAAGANVSPLRGGHSAGNVNMNNPAGNRTLSRAISMGANIGSAGAAAAAASGYHGGVAYLGRASASGTGGVRRMTRSRTFTDVAGGSVPTYGVGGGFLGGGNGLAGDSVSPVRSPMGYRMHTSSTGLDGGSPDSGLGGSGGGGGGGGAFQLFPIDNRINLDGDDEEHAPFGAGMHGMQSGSTEEGSSAHAPSLSSAATGGVGGVGGLAQGLSGATDDSFLLFGGKLLSLDLENEAADVVSQKESEKRGNTTPLAGTTITVPMPVDAAAGGGSAGGPSTAMIENRESLALSSPDRIDLGEFPSVDLNAFKAGLASSSSFGTKNSSGSGGGGGIGGGSDPSAYLASLPAEHGITIHKSISGKGSISFNKAAEDAVAEHTTATASAVASGSGADGHSTIRVEGWPSPSSNTTSPQQQPPHQVLSSSLPSEQSLPTQSSQGSLSGRGMKRVESAAAIRLRNLFETEEDGNYSGSDASGITTAAAAAVASIPQKGKKTLSAPPSFASRPGSSTATATAASQPRSVQSTSPAPIRAPHQTFTGATAVSPFDQMASPPEGDNGGQGAEEVFSPHHILSPRAAAAAANINLPSTITSGQVWDSSDVGHKEEDTTK